MIESSADIEISAPPRRVWEALVDFAAYPEWNPYVAVRGSAALGSEIQWAYSSRIIKRVWTSATITEFDEPNAITWSFRIGWLFRFEERFRVHATRNGTRLTHSIRCRGMIARLGKQSLRKTFAGVISAANNGLRRHIEPVSNVSLKSPLGGTSPQAKAKKKGVRARSRRR